jgi:predicted RND superfamily exporter protein
MEDALPETAFSMRFARLIMRYRFATLMALLSMGFFFFTPLLNGVYYAATGEKLPGLETSFSLGTSLRDQYPEHPFIHASDKFSGRFGTASLVALAVVKKDGEIYDTDFLYKVERITNKLDEAPFVNHYQVSSITHINTRVISIEPDGGIVAEPLIEEIPEEEEELQALRDTVLQNPGLIYGLQVSRDHKAVLIRAGFITHRIDSREHYEELFDYVMNLKAEEEDETVEIYVSGGPIATGWVLRHAFEIMFFLLVTIVMLFFLLLAYFQRLHGVAIPMVAGLATAIWGLGFTSWIGIKLDPLILVIPLLITARSISHTIQMAERFFEDYEMETTARAERLGRDLTTDEITETKIETATTAMAKLMMPGMLGIITDAAGLMVIFITSIQQMRNLALFGSFWVLAIFFNVILLHPIMIAYLPPPHSTKHFTWRFVDRALDLIGRVATSRLKYAVVGFVAISFVWATYYTLYNSTIGHSRPGAPIFWEDHEFNVATGKISEHFGGVDNFTVFVDGDGRASSSDGFVLQRMEALDRYMRMHLYPEYLGNSVSIVTLIRAFWQGAHYGDPKWGFVPESASSIGGIIFNLVNNSTPGALRPFLTDDSEDANVTFYFRDHKGTTIRRAVHWAEDFIHENPMGRVNVRLRQDPSPSLDVVYYMLGPVLFPRNHHMTIQVAQIDDQQEIQGYSEAFPSEVGEWSEPIARDEVVQNVIAELKPLRRNKKLEVTEASHTIDDLEIKPDRLGKAAVKLSANHDYRVETARYKADEVGEEQWIDMTVGEIADYIVDRSVFKVLEKWDGGEDSEIHAQSIRFCETYCDYELWVKNDKFKDASWNPQPTKSWTRGSEFVMAGGLMGVLAAVNDEVERGHVANILLIFLIVFTFVSVSYRSATAGGVIMFSLACGTIFSLAYMALRENGLNVNTLPVQSVGVGIGVDYAIYITDRIRQEASWSGDLDEGIRRAIKTTGMAVSFTATTLIGGIIWWSFSNLRFQAEMAQLLSILMFVNMIGGIFLVPSLFSIFRPKFFAASLVRDTETSAAESGATATAIAAEGKA